MRGWWLGLRWLWRYRREWIPDAARAKSMADAKARMMAMEKRYPLENLLHG